MTIILGRVHTYHSSSLVHTTWELGFIFQMVWFALMYTEYCPVIGQTVRQLEMEIPRHFCRSLLNGYIHV